MLSVKSNFPYDNSNTQKTPVNKRQLQNGKLQSPILPHPQMTNHPKGGSPP